MGSVRAIKKCRSNPRVLSFRVIESLKLSLLWPVCGKAVDTTNISHMRKQWRVTAKLISAFVFATCIVQFLFFLKPKFPVSSHLLCLYSTVCVEPVQKPHCWLSHDELKRVTGIPSENSREGLDSISISQIIIVVVVFVVNIFVGSLLSAGFPDSEKILWIHTRSY